MKNFRLLFKRLVDTVLIACIPTNVGKRLLLIFCDLFLFITQKNICVEDDVINIGKISHLLIQNTEKWF